MFCSALFVMSVRVSSVLIPHFLARERVSSLIEDSTSACASSRDDIDIPLKLCESVIATLPLL